MSSQVDSNASKGFAALPATGTSARLQTTAIGRQVQLKHQGWQSFDHDDLHSHASTAPADKVVSWLHGPREANRVQQWQSLHQDKPTYTRTWTQVHLGAKSGSIKERRGLRLPVLHPESAFFFNWNVFMGLWDALYTSFCIPISIAFVNYPSPWNAIIVLDLIAGFIFFVDILINFRTGFEVMGRTRRIIMKPRAIAKYYILYDTFIVDALCVVPTPFVAFMMFTHETGGWVVHYSAVLKVLLLLRLPRMWRFFAMVQVRGGIQVLYKVMSSGVLYGLNIVYTTAVLINFMACLLVATAHFEGITQSWLSHVGAEDLSFASKGRQYIAAIYFAMGTIAGAGYGDVVAQTPLEEIVCAMVMCCGCVFIGFLVGTFSHLINEASAEGRSASAFRKKLDGIEAWMRHRDLPKVLQARIKSYYVEVLQPGTEDEDLNQLSQLPTALRDEVVAYLTKDVLEHSPIFGVLGKHERRYLARRLRPLTLPMGHDLFKEGDDATSMYILQEGTVVLLRHTHDLQCFQAPAFVGETVILASTWEHARFRETTCRAESSCLLWELKMKDLNQVVNVFPHIMEDLRMAFLDHIKSSIADMMQQDPDKRLAYALLDDDVLESMPLFGSHEDLPDALETSSKSSTVPGLKVLSRIRLQPQGSALASNDVSHSGYEPNSMVVQHAGSFSDQGLQGSKAGAQGAPEEGNKPSSIGGRSSTASLQQQLYETRQDNSGASMLVMQGDDEQGDPADPGSRDPGNQDNKGGTSWDPSRGPSPPAPDQQWGLPQGPVGTSKAMQDKAVREDSGRRGRHWSEDSAAPRARAIADDVDWNHAGMQGGRSRGILRQDKQTEAVRHGSESRNNSSVSFLLPQGNSQEKLLAASASDSVGSASSDGYAEPTSVSQAISSTSSALGHAVSGVGAPDVEQGLLLPARVPAMAITEQRLRPNATAQTGLGRSGFGRVAQSLLMEPLLPAADAAEHSNASVLPSMRSTTSHTRSSPFDRRAQPMPISRSQPRSPAAAGDYTPRRWSDGMARSGSLRVQHSIDLLLSSQSRGPPAAGRANLSDLSTWQRAVLDSLPEQRGDRIEHGQ